MHDHPGLAGTGSGQDQHVVVFMRRHQRHLFGILQIVDDALERLLTGGPLQNLFAVGEIAFHEGVFVHRKVGDDKGQRLTDFIQTAPGVFIDHMHLENALAVMLRKRLVVALVIAAAFSSWQHLYRHRLPEHGQPFLQRDDVLFMQKIQRPLDGGQRVLDVRRSHQILL